MILINGAPGTGKSTLAKVLCAATGATLIRTDDFLDVSHKERPAAIVRNIEALDGLGPFLIVEGCEVDRLIKHDLLPSDALLLCTGFDAQRPKCEALAARARKYFELWPGEKYLVKGAFSLDGTESAG